MATIEQPIYSDYRLQFEDGKYGYAAGLPGYKRNFSRDVFIAGNLTGNTELISSQINIAASQQGSQENPATGEMIGKIHHELPGLDIWEDDRLTTYNACDTTPLFLIAIEGLSVADSYEFGQFLKSRIDSLEKAVDYIVAHTSDDFLFTEKPPLDAAGYALRVTYWKDSILPNLNGKLEPEYPVIYSQAHFIAARGLLSAARVLRDNGIANIADKMFQAGIETAIQTDGYLIYKDSQDELQQPSSDELHALAYIPQTYADLLPLEAMSDRAAEFLATPFGYKCTPSEIAQHLADRYHGDKVWIFEQANIHYGATKFGLTDEAAVAASVAPHIGSGQELLGIMNGAEKHFAPVPDGNPRQLWSVAAAEYFAGDSLLQTNPWL